ncbi:hypothetical protein LguiA_009192 [Lonicera macranthoides]
MNLAGRLLLDAGQIDDDDCGKKEEFLSVYWENGNWVKDKQITSFTEFPHW